jgi:hypothetical protein
VRRISTWLLFGAVVALGVAAAVDALRGEPDPDEAAAEAQPRAAAPPADPGERTLAEARADLRAAGVPAGVLTYADAQCRLHTVTLPDLGPHPGAEGLACQFRPPAPSGGLTSRCRRGWLELRMPNGALHARARGCDLAWRPDGTPTFLRNGAVRQFAPCSGAERGTYPIRCSQTVLARADLIREFRRVGWTDFDFRVEELHWLDDSRFAAIVQARSVSGGADLLAIFEKRRLVADPASVYNDLSGIRLSPSGSLVSARILNPGGIVTVDRDGRSVRLALRHGDAVAWSPDEEWLAEATADGIYIFRAGELSPQFVHIPIVARDLVWR